MDDIELRTLQSADRSLAMQFIRVSSTLFLQKGDASTFAEQPVATLVPPTGALPASAYFMFFPPAFTQPVHFHPDARLLILVTDSPVVVEHWANRDGRLTLDNTSVTTPGDVTMVRIKPGVWHRFAVQGEGAGSIALSFHPVDTGDDDTFASPHLMEALTTFHQDAVQQSPA